MTYSAISRRFWHDEKVRAWSNETKLLAIYLLSSPHSNMLGLYVLPLQYAAYDLDMTIEQVKKGMAELDSFCEYDPTTSVVLVYKFLQYNIIKNPNQAKGAVTKLYDLPETTLFKQFRNSLINSCATVEKPEKDDSKKIQHPTEFDEEGTPLFVYLPSLFIPLYKAIEARINCLPNCLKTVIPTVSNKETDSVPAPAPVEDSGKEKYVPASSDEKSPQPVRNNSQQPTPYKEIVELFNVTCPSLPQVTNPDEWTETRKKRVRTLWRKISDISAWKAFFERIERSHFLTGETKAGFVASFDWILKPSNLLKIKEGNYDNKGEKEDKLRDQAVARFLEE